MAEGFIGCKISLMSKAKARYEGILASVDVGKHTVTLQNGESEGRASNFRPCCST